MAWYLICVAALCDKKQTSVESCAHLSLCCSHYTIRSKLSYTDLIFITECGDVEVIADGTVTYAGGLKSYLSEATFSCNVGYTLSAIVTRVCEANSTWSLANPTCNINGKLLIYAYSLTHLILVINPFEPNELSYLYQ